jgi:2-amino-4-hydroxy-6-hydroxymethyldihydropteridine diphosphokinase
MKLVYLGLGSNMGDREALLKLALDELAAPDLRLVRVSSVYETEPVGLREQRWFLNLVAEFETELFPKQLLRRTQRIEVALGRKRTIVNGPRTIDIDILLYGKTVMKTEELEIPHPRYRERRYDSSDNTCKISPLFEKYAFDSKNWTVGEQFFGKFPEMQLDLPCSSGGQTQGPTALDNYTV